MILIERIWGSFSFIGALYIASYIVASRLEQRYKKRPLALTIFFLIMLIFGGAIGWIYSDIIPQVTSKVSLGVGKTAAVTSGLLCGLIFVSAYAEVKILFQCKKTEALFCASAGYCMQHMTQRLASVINILIFQEKSDFLGGTILTAVTVLIYFFIYSYIITDAHYNRIAVDGKMQIFVSVIVILITTVLSAAGDGLADWAGMWQLKIIIQILCVLSAALALFLEFSLLRQKNAEDERDILTALMKENAAQFEIQKNAIDAINVKCHDLKHQLQRLEKGIDSEYLTEVKEAVNNYDFVVHTGNEALDTVITMKSLTCENKGITFTFFGDGRLIDFINAADTYSLFGNMLDNAIEAVDAVTDPDLKAISMTIEQQNNIVLIHCENYFETDIVYKDGKPLTHKEDKENHGFGIHSMQLMADKYQGTLRFSDENHIFMIDLAFFKG